MKKYFIKAFAIIAIALGFSFSINAQFVVKIRPGAPVVSVRPACPSPAHVWINGNYAWRNNNYTWTDGYWALPPHRGHHWKEGFWKKSRGGWTWVPGHWKR